jgi:hypothetical protein
MGFFKYILVVLISSISLIARGSPTPTISPSALEGTLTFQSKVVMPEAYKNRIPELIREQVKHLLGVFEADAFSKINNLPSNDKLGALGIGNLLNFKVLNVNGSEITYAAKFRLLMRRDVLKENSSRNIKIYFPHDPVAFYVRECTDEENYQKQYLFYYWNPFRPACHEKLTGKNTVDEVDARIDSFNYSDSNATPDYDSLRRIINQRGELRIALLFGFDESTSKTKDEGRQSYVYFQKYFEAHGFDIDRKQKIPTGPFTEYVKPLTVSGRYQVHISMSLSYSDQPNPIVFAKRAREAFENADIVMYVGHSGLGGNLDLEKITRLSSQDPDRPTPIQFRNDYQVFFIDSCASFFFYLSQYEGVQPKADVVTNGLASFFYTQNLETKNFLEAFIEPQGSMTWMQILSATEKGSTNRHFSYLINVVH